ncbi:helix-turn-helix transcriptional regulator [Amycolatopsis sp. NPDC059657]|uniref:helix-turn-helix transcriptional regulator n=1 Tax=Amycolatopsis sp. NPDC059657 TaxID=3346899 RepID=UPI00366A7BB3
MVAELVFTATSRDDIHANFVHNYFGASHVTVSMEDGPGGEFRFSMLSEQTAPVRLVELASVPAFDVAGKLTGENDDYTIQIARRGDGVTEQDGEQAKSVNNIADFRLKRYRTLRRQDTLFHILLVSRAEMDRAVAEHLGYTPRTSVSFDADLRTSDPVVGAWMNTVAAYGDAWKSGMFAASPLAQGHFQQLLVHGLIAAQPHSFHQRLTAQPTTLLAETVRRAAVFCEDNAHGPISVTDMAAAARTSVRALQKGFRSQFGMSPMGYLRRVRLSRVHDDLVAIRRGTAMPSTVTEVALRWGFVHLGRFAQVYRETYGEPPSATAGLSGKRPRNGTQNGYLSRGQAG